MHRKTSTAIERLGALRALIVAVVSRTGVAVIQILAIALGFLGGVPVVAVKTVAAAPASFRTARLAAVAALGVAFTFVRGLRLSDVRAAIATLVRRRGAAAGLAYASVLVLAVVAGGSALAQSEPNETPTVAVADAQDRLAAAERADRSSRTDAAPAPAAADAASAAPAPPPDWVAPMANAPLSSCFGPRWGRLHRGLDFAGQDGSPIRAVGAGTVVAAGWLYGGYGNSTVIDHGNGYLTHYAHARALNVAAGQQVKAGDVIAWEGNTGNSTGPHLHFEVHRGLWNQVDPAAFLRERGVKVGC
jgi:murein DD-endopeptidase MepM/ murein hydrolase activator NlpD